MPQERLEALGWDFGPLWPGGTCGFTWDGVAGGVQPVRLMVRPAPRAPDPGETWSPSDWCLTCRPDYTHFLADELLDPEPVFAPLSEFLAHTAAEWAEVCVTGDAWTEAA